MHIKEFTTLSGKEVKLPIENRMYINGEFVTSDETFEVTAPSTGEHLTKLPIGSSEQIDEAVWAAKEASKEWCTHSPWERREAVERLANVILDHSEELTNLDIADNGSCISRMQYDAEKAAKSLQFFGGLATEIKGQEIPTKGETVDFTRREPYGAVAAILPFNHPVMFAVKKIAPAIIAGNGIVIKPSEQTPLSALYVGRLIEEADVFPDGLVNVITGRGITGAELVQHSAIGLITMVGSVQTGKTIMKDAATNLTPVILELGGKNPNIVFPDADLEEAAQGAISGMALSWQGQSCGSGSRLLVHENIYHEIVSRVVDGFNKVNVGDPFDASSTMGSIVSKAQFDSVIEYIETAKEEGATLLTGGEVIDDYDAGYFVEPTVFEVKPDMTIAQEEIFGPVLSVLKWSDYDEMLSIANGVDQGLTASLWTNDLRTAHCTSNALEVGYVWVNQIGPHYLGAPYGGFKESGIGKTGSIEELLDHTRVKNINIDIKGELIQE